MSQALLSWQCELARIKFVPSSLSVEILFDSLKKNAFIRYDRKNINFKLPLF